MDWMNIFWIAAAILGVAGAANWLLLGVFNINIVEILFSAWAAFLIKPVYALAGAGGIATIAKGWWNK